MTFLSCKHCPALAGRAWLACAADGEVFGKEQTKGTEVTFKEGGNCVFWQGEKRKLDSSRAVTRSDLLMARDALL